MGTTIRREPVNFAIPAAPDYKFLNITNFRGLDVSSNPFELANNTASDCLNVYVDETNTLTTRPRLEKKVDAPIKGTHIGTYNLHNGYLLHYVKDGVGVLAIYRTDEITFITGQDLTPNETDTTKKEFLELPTTKCEYFEQDDKIYLLDGTRYLVIHENVLSEVVGYVPTTAIVSLDGTRQPVETRNILSDEYREKYYWDGLSKFPFDDEDAVAVENEYYKEYSFPEGFVPLQTYADFSAFGYFESESTLSYITFVPDEEPTKLSFDVQYNLIGYRNFATDAKVFWRVQGRSRIVRYELNGDTLTTMSSIDMVTEPGILAVSPDGMYAITSKMDTGTAPSHYELINAGANMSVTEFSRPATNMGNIAISNNFIYWYSLASDENKLTVYSTPVTSLASFTVFDTFNFNDVMRIETVADDSVLMLSSIRAYASDPVTLVVYTNRSPATRVIKSVHLPSSDPILSPDGIVQGSRGWTGKTPIPFWYYPMSTNLDEYLTWQIGDYYNTEGSESGFFEWRYAMIHKNKYVALSTNYYFKTVSKYYVFKNSTEPMLSVIKKSEPSEHKNKLLGAKLLTRFDNNYWFAVNNRYYRSKDNDPTYFPVTEYNDLGDSNEHITGFNLANDTTLVAYKPTKIYLIQPFESSVNTREYSITESKNTVGNTAIGAPIVTTLTEIPLQINNDGIYGLSQLQNVSAVERIADLMSEPINEKWLKEDDVVISNAKTINRLYWTYVILPYEDKTEVYLLDNRSNSWYYWELPIAINDAFVKDNVTEFVDKAGAIFYLTPDDVINKAFLPLLVTEYYDYGRKLIPWYWQSQILHLGTMNYSKRLVNTTFILTDTDTQDGYGLQYSFKVFRKLASSTPEKEISDELNLVRSTTKKTNISKFGFVQLKLSNITEESQGTDPEKAYRNNKLRLVGLGLKYVLLEGLIR